MSHCKDALLIGWSIEKIGVDIERSDRQFNFKDISEKYFLNDEKELKKLNHDKLRLAILNLWVLKEAAIKWQEGSIIRDLSMWKINKNYKSAYHQSLKLSINTFCLNKKSWVLGVAYESREIHYEDTAINFY